MKQNNTILIVGGAGYIGAHVAKLLAEKGYSLVIFDNLSTGYKSQVKWGKFEEGNLNSPDIERVMKKYLPHTVIHLAGSCYVGESVTDPGKYYRNNVAGTISLLEAMRTYQIPQLIFSSSCTVYGIPEKLPIKENTPLGPISPYGRSKLMIEQIIRDYTDAYGLHAVIFRYFNACGADPELEIGENHVPETHLIPLVLATAQDPTNQLKINGNTFATPDGTCVRDYLHVTDIASAHLRVLEQSMETPCQIYNLGTGKGHSILEIIHAAEKITEKSIPYTVGPSRPGDPAQLIADPSYANRQLQWEAKHSDLSTILNTAWLWQQKKK